MSPPTLSNHPLGLTGQYTAACRALESGKDTPKFVDPWAAKFAGEQGDQLLDSKAQALGVSKEQSTARVTVRTSFLDEIVMKAVTRSAPETRQCVIVAVGGDARPYRLDFPSGTVVYEIDFPEVVNYRKGVFGEDSPKCEVRSIGADVRDAEWVAKLAAEGFDPSKPSVWIMEGLLMYLTEPQCRTFISEVSSLCQPGSVLGGDVFTSNSVNIVGQNPYSKVWLEFGAQVGNLGIDDPKAFLEDFGFQTTCKGIEELYGDYGLAKYGGGRELGGKSGEMMICIEATKK